jgi:hypothetical protein
MYIIFNPFFVTASAKTVGVPLVKNNQLTTQSVAAGEVSGAE